MNKFQQKNISSALEFISASGRAEIGTEYQPLERALTLAIISDIPRMQSNFRYFLLLLTIVTCSCSTSYEVVNPFKNLAYFGDMLFPVKTNYSEFTFRIWIGNSTSIDRIISISKDSARDFQGNLIEFGKTFNGRKYKPYYNDIKIAPKSGFTAFKQKLDDLDLFTLQNKNNIDWFYMSHFQLML